MAPRIHGEPRPPIGSDAAVDEASDVRVAQAGEDLPLGEKAPVRLDGVEAAPHELERDALLELTVGALGDVDRAHPAARQLDDHAVWPDQSSGLEIFDCEFVWLEPGRRCPVARESLHILVERAFEEIHRVELGRDQCLGVGAKLGIAGAGPIEIVDARLGREVEDLIENWCQALPALGSEASHESPE